MTKAAHCDVPTTIATSLLAFFPGIACAHGEQALLFPIGTLLALAAVIALGLLCRIHWIAILCAGAFSIAASLPFWMIPGNVWPLTHADWGYFVIGFVPSMGVGTFAVWLVRCTRKALPSKIER